ncbi:MAG: YajQ family cyclic di-GMP-binding protein [Oscillospiraceae bacterium]|nr:YajQ family cyclic di-GMP-binding protein [Oscillospiraceae bacterium]
MAKDLSFDIVSQVDMQELDNALNQTKKEISQRYDFKGSIVDIVQNKDSIKIVAEDEYRINAALEILKAKMVKRNIPPKNLQCDKIESAFSGNKKLEIKVQNGISKEKAKDVVAAIKALKLKVTSEIQDEKIRVSGAKKDELQTVIHALKEKDFGIELQFINYR